MVFATALTIEPGAVGRVGASWRPLLACVLTKVTVLPALSWAASRLVAAGSLRDGVMAVGLAPCEIASVATTAMAGGEAALAAGALATSTLATIVVAGPVLTLEAGHAHIRPGHIIANLALVVALPLEAGLCLRAARIRFGPTAEMAATTTATVSVAAVPGELPGRPGGLLGPPFGNFSGRLWGGCHGRRHLVDVRCAGEAQSDHAGLAFAVPPAHQRLELGTLVVGEPAYPHWFSYGQSMAGMLSQVVDQAGVPDRSGH